MKSQVLTARLDSSHVSVTRIEEKRVIDFCDCLYRLAGIMATSPESGIAEMPAAVSAIKPATPDAFHPVPVTPEPARPVPADQGPSTYDYTENAPQAVVDAIAIERKREEMEGPAEMMVGSWTSWSGDDGGEPSFEVHWLNPDRGIYPSSTTRAPMRPGSRRASIVSRNSSSYNRPSFAYHRHSSTQADVLHSPTSGVFVADSEDEGMGGQPPLISPFSPSSPIAGPSNRRVDGRRRSKAPMAASYREDYFRRARAPSDDGDDLPHADDMPQSPSRPNTTLGMLASFIGLNHQDHDEEANVGQRRSTSLSQSRQGSFASSRPSRPRSSSVSSSERWGYESGDTGETEQAESYSSSLADDTSLPPQSRPGSPSIPLIPSASDGIFGDPSRGDTSEPKDFASVAVASRQTILLPDEDLSIRFTCYRTDPLRNVLWWLGCILSLGALGLLGRWVPSVWVRWCGKETTFEDAKSGAWLVVEVSTSVVCILTRRHRTATCTSSLSK